MLHHERLRPPSHDYPADEWNVVEKAFHPELLAQLETMLALGNGYLGIRGCPEEGGPNAENGTFINGFYETRPIIYGEEAYGFARTGQTICNGKDGEIGSLLRASRSSAITNCALGTTIFVMLFPIMLPPVFFLVRASAHDLPLRHPAAGRCSAFGAVLGSNSPRTSVGRQDHRHGLRMDRSTTAFGDVVRKP